MQNLHPGVLADSDEESSQPFRYLGRYGIMDDGNGLYYARARHFSPQLGRFLSKDPVLGKDSNSQSLNRYIYALNNAVRFSDASGLSPNELAMVQSDPENSFKILQLLSEIAGNAHPIEFSVELSRFILVDSKLAGIHLPERLMTYVDTQFGGYRVGEYRISPDASIDLRGLGKTVQFLSKGFEIYSIVKSTGAELSDRGVTIGKAAEAFRNIGANVDYAIKNPDALIQAGIEGLTSTSAFALNALTFGLLDIKGSQIQRGVLGLVNGQ